VHPWNLAGTGYGDSIEAAAGSVAERLEASLREVVAPGTRIDHRVGIIRPLEPVVHDAA
jgi:hypothetical protein